MAIGVLLWAITWLVNRRTNAGKGGPSGASHSGHP